MQIDRLVAMSLWILACLAGSAAARPRPVIVQPEIPFMLFDRTPFDERSPTQRVVIRNDGDPVHHEEFSVFGPFTVVATGGSLGTDEVKFWDLACTPTTPGGINNSGRIFIEFCGVSCEDDWSRTISLQCQAGFLDTSDTDIFLFAYAYSSAQDTLSFTNPGPDPLTITSFASHDPSSSLALASGTLPVTLAAGDSFDVIATFSPTGSGPMFTFGDVIAGTTIVGRTNLRAETRSQLALAGGFSEIPLGASYAIPITVRNSYPSARTIAAVTSDHPGDVVTGLAGVVLAPGEFASGMVTVTADTLGLRVGTLWLEFDVGQGDLATFGYTVVPATYALTASDSSPNDGTIDFGARKTGSAPVEQTFTITNLTAVDAPVSGCSSSTAPFELVGACPTVLPASGSVQLTVRFSPAALGDVFGFVSLQFDSFRHIHGLLKARVVASQLEFSSTELIFPDTMQAASVQRSVTITNTADSAIIVPITVTGESFASSAPEVTIPGREAAEVVVDFAPAAPGMFTGALELGVAGDPDHAIIALSGTGLGPNEPPSEGGGGGGGDPGEDEDHGGGCTTGGQASGLAIALAILVMRRRRSGGSR